MCQLYRFKKIDFVSEIPIEKNMEGCFRITDRKNMYLKQNVLLAQATSETHKDLQFFDRLLAFQGL